MHCRYCVLLNQVSYNVLYRKERVTMKLEKSLCPSLSWKYIKQNNLTGEEFVLLSAGYFI
jgi:hypothetical protein